MIDPSPTKVTTPKTIGIVGYGSFGTLLHTLLQRFVPAVEVRINSSRSAPDGVKFFSLEEVGKCDAVILAVPIHAFEETLRKLLLLMRADTIIVDVATVKVYTTEILKRLAGSHPYIAMHPMFGPESYKKKGENVAGLRIVMCDGTLPVERYNTLTAFLKKCSFDVVEMSAEQHDRHLAETLFLTHFIGQIVARGGFNRTEIDTVSFGYLMDAVESIRHDTRLFEDVFRFNPYCEEVLKRFEIAESEVHALLKKRA